MQEALEQESKAKAEVNRTKKKLEADVVELEGALEQANQVHEENQRNIRKYQDNIQKANMNLEDEQHAKDVARENLVNAERKANAYQNALEESRTMLDAAKLAEELRNEQDHTARVEQDRRVAEAQIKDLQIKIDEVETAALKHGKKACAKLESRIKELEFQSEEDRKHASHMQDLVDKLQNKLR